MTSIGPADQPAKYTLGPVVGAGGEGVVYRAVRHAPAPRTEVAVKIVRHAAASALSDLETGLEQVEIARTIRSPGIVPVLEGFIAAPVQDGPARLCLVSEWADGQTLLDAAAALSPSEVLDALQPVATALDDMHQARNSADLPIIHGDVKPSNIIVSPGGRARLVDLGLARPAGTGRPGLGTRGFVSEAARAGEYEASTDRYAFAKTVSAALEATDVSLHRQAAADVLDADAVASSAEPLSDWLGSAAATIGQRPGSGRGVLLRAGAAVLVVGAIAGFSGARLGATATDCVAADFAAAARVAEVPWSDPDGDCLHSAFEAINESPADVESPQRTTPSVTDQVADIPPHLLECRPGEWAALAAASAPEPPRQSWIDSDGDCLHNAFELNALGIDPLAADTDGDGTPDTFDAGRPGLVHDPLAQLRYVDRIAGISTLADTLDAVACDPLAMTDAAAAWVAQEGLDVEWVDSDGDCVSDAYERDVLGTDPDRSDSDGDGIGDATDPDVSNGLIEPVDLQLNDGFWRAFDNVEQAEQDDPGSQPRALD